MGERVLGFAYSRLDNYDFDFKFSNKPSPNFPTDGLCFLGLVSMIDPPKEGVVEAIQTCKKAAIKVFMVTGNFKAFKHKLHYFRICYRPVH